MFVTMGYVPSQYDQSIGRHGRLFLEQRRFIGVRGPGTAVGSRARDFFGIRRRGTLFESRVFLAIQRSKRKSPARLVGRYRASKMVPLVGIELTTFRLQGGCSTN
jgi:hypothetical protein